MRCRRDCFDRERPPGAATAACDQTRPPVALQAPKPRESLPVHGAIGGVQMATREPSSRHAIAQQKPWRCVPGERMADLVGRPRGRRVPGHVDMQDLASVMGQHDEHKQHPKCKRWDHEEVDRDELNRTGFLGDRIR